MLIMVPNFFTKSLIGNSVYVIVKAEEVANFCVFLEIESYCSCVHTTSEIAVLWFSVPLCLNRLYTFLNANGQQNVTTFKFSEAFTAYISMRFLGAKFETFLRCIVVTKVECHMYMSIPSHRGHNSRFINYFQQLCFLFRQNYIGLGKPWRCLEWYAIAIFTL